jgi:hypothetical protein
MDVLAVTSTAACARDQAVIGSHDSVPMGCRYTPDIAAGIV